MGTPDTGSREEEGEAEDTSMPISEALDIEPAWISRLRDAGMETVEDLASAEAATLAEETGLSEFGLRLHIRSAQNYEPPEAVPQGEAEGGVELQEFLNRPDSLLVELHSHGVTSSRELAACDPQDLALGTSYRLSEAKEDVRRAREHHGLTGPSGSQTSPEGQEGTSPTWLQEAEPATKSVEPEETRPSGAWYLVALLTGILGGALGYIAVKDQAPRMANQLLWVGIISSVIGVGILLAI